MKRFPSFYLPVGVAAVAAIWFVGEVHGLQALEAKQALLQQRLDHSSTLPGRSRGQRAPLPGENRPGALPFDRDGHLDWQQLSSTYRDANGLQLQKWLQSLTADELLAEYDSLSASSWPPRLKLLKDVLSRDIAGVLSRRDPGLALETFRDRIAGRTDEWATLLAGAVQRLAETDPARAAAWIDGLAAEGRMQSRGTQDTSPRLLFEAELIRSALRSDPGLAAQRLEAIPPGQRADFFAHSSLADAGPELMPAVVDLWHRSLSEADQLKVLQGYVQSAATTGEGDMTKMTAWLDAAQAEGEPRTGLITGAIGRAILVVSIQNPELTGDRFTQFGHWVRSTDPENAGRIMAGAASQLVNRLPLAKAAEIILQQEGDAGYRDQLIAGVLTVRAGQGDPETAKKLGAEISSPELRESLMKKIFPARP